MLDKIHVPFHPAVCEVEQGVWRLQKDRGEKRALW